MKQTVDFLHTGLDRQASRAISALAFGPLSKPRILRVTLEALQGGVEVCACRSALRKRVVLAEAAQRDIGLLRDRLLYDFDYDGGLTVSSSSKPPAQSCRMNLYSACDSPSSPRGISDLLNRFMFIDRFLLAGVPMSLAYAASASSPVR
jgi:hypothetical protein